MPFVLGFDWVLHGDSLHAFFNAGKSFFGYPVEEDNILGYGTFREEEGEE